jgi:hypothetical protein
LLCAEQEMSLFLSPPPCLPPPCCCHSRDNLLSVCWKCILILINFTVTFTELLHLAWISLPDIRTEVICKAIFRTPAPSCLSLVLGWPLGSSFAAQGTPYHEVLLHSRPKSSEARDLRNREPK